MEAWGECNTTKQNYETSRRYKLSEVLLSVLLINIVIISDLTSYYAYGSRKDGAKL